MGVRNVKGSDWKRLVFAHRFPLNSRSPIAPSNFISDAGLSISHVRRPGLSKLADVPLMMEFAQLVMGALLFKTNR